MRDEEKGRPFFLTVNIGSLSPLISFSLFAFAIVRISAAIFSRKRVTIALQAA